jgi:competence protein ComEC
MKKATLWIRKLLETKTKPKQIDFAPLDSNQWQAMPLVRIVLSFAVGIISQPIFLLLLVYIILAGSLATYFLLLKHPAHKHRWLAGLAIHSICFSFGVLVTYYHQDIHQPNHFSNYPATVTACIKLEEELAPKAGKARVLATVQSIDYQGIDHLSEGNVLIYLPYDAAAQKLHYGSLLKVSLRYQKIRPLLNPGEFNYQNYLKHKNIYYQLQLNADSYKVVGNDISNPFKVWAYKIKSIILYIYRTYIHDRKQSGVAAALIFGYRDDLDAELVDAYSHTGTLHVLAVSGLHVGIVYYLLKILFQWLAVGRRRQIVRSIFILMGLWFYALLTGFSPSVLRATIMFSCIVVGDVSSRQTNIYNSIATSALILFCFDPEIIYDVGFQLSYSAVIGIVYLQPKIGDLYIPKNRIWEMLWGLTTVSIAAQLATFPLSLYYFNQFPTYFLIANLVIIPLSTMVTYVGLFLLPASFIPWVADGVGFLLNSLIELTDDIVLLIDKLPYAAINGVYITEDEALVLFLFLLFILLYFIYKQKTYIYISCTAFLYLSVSFTMSYIEHQRQQELWVYAIPNHTCVEYFQGTHATMIADSNYLGNKNMVRYKFQTHWWQSGIKTHQYQPIKHLNNSGNLSNQYIQTSFLNLYILKASLLNIPSKPIDIVVISGSPFLKPEQILALRAKHIVFDQSCNAAYLKYWKHQCVSHHIKAWFTNEQGAFAYTR